MAGKTLMKLKVSELKKELVERDLDTTGNKAVLQLRLEEALRTEGLDPETHVFENENGFAEVLSVVKEELGTTSRALKEELGTTSRALEEKLSEMEEKFAEGLDNSLRTLEGKLAEIKEELGTSLEEKFAEGLADFRISSTYLQFLKLKAFLRNAE